MSVHPTAIVSPDARLGRDVAVGPFAVIEEGAVIGDGCEIRAHAVVKRFTSLGVGNRVHEGAVLGGEPQDLSFGDLETGLRIGDRNVIREGVTIHRSTKEGGATVVGSDCFLMAYVHVAHDNRIGDRVILANNVMLAGHVEIAERAFLGGGCRRPPVLPGRPPGHGGREREGRAGLPAVRHHRRPPGACPRPQRRRPAARRRDRVPAARPRGGLPPPSPVRPRPGGGPRRDGRPGDPLVDEWTAFVRGSKRGFAHAHRRGAKDEA